MNPNDKRLVAARVAASNGTLTREQYKEVFLLMREDRECAHVISAKSKAKKVKPQIDTEALLNQLLL